MSLVVLGRWVKGGEAGLALTVFLGCRWVFGCKRHGFGWKLGWFLVFVLYNVAQASRLRKTSQPGRLRYIRENLAIGTVTVHSGKSRNWGCGIM